MNFSRVHTKFPGPVETSLAGLTCLSLDHKHADLSLLEQVERCSTELTSALRNTTRGAVVLATCNRFEAYFEASHEAGPDALDTADTAVQSIAQVTGVPEHELAEALRVHRGVEAARHLFAVSSGLESAVVGEGEIGGQVRRAYQDAKRSGSTTPTLERLFQRAASVSKTVKARTRVQTQGRSLVRLSLKLAESRVGAWRDTRVLLVGTGAYAAVTLAALRERGAQHIAVHSPSGRAQDFARTRDVRPIAAADLHTELADADVVIACSMAQDPILDAPLVARTVTASARPFCARFTGRPATVPAPKSRLFIDLGMPRNIAPDAATIPGVELLNLEIIALHANVDELSAASEARQITLEAAHEFASDGAELSAVPAVLALRDHVHAVLEAELERASKLGPQSHVAQAALKHFAGRLLHEPSVRLRALGRAGRAAEGAAAVHTLFGEESASPPLTSSQCPHASTP